MHRAIAGAGFSQNEEVLTWRPASWGAGARDPRYDAIVQALRARVVEDRAAREKRQQLWYRQSLESDASTTGSSPIRLAKFPTKVPCHTTPEARALLAELRKQFPGSTISLPRVEGGAQAIMLTGPSGTLPIRIGRVEHSVPTDPRLGARQGLAVETDGGGLLVLRFRYPATPVRVCFSQGSGEESLPGEGDFTEIRAALDLRPPHRSSAPRLVWVTSPEGETMNALGSRAYEAFYVRFKLEVQAGIWNALSGLLATSPGSEHDGSYYSVVQQPDPSSRRINQRTVDDRGRAVDIGLDRVYDVAAATDILLLYLEGDILADFAEIYFTLHSLGSPGAAGAWTLQHEFFTAIRRFWSNAPSLASQYGSNLAAVVRMSQRAVPVPAQAPLLKQDWTNLRQSLVDRYGEAGRQAMYLACGDSRSLGIGPSAWPFASFPAGEVNIGLRLVHRNVAGKTSTMLRGLGARTDMDLEPSTRPTEVENVVLVAEKLPAPAEIDLAWARQHAWILGKVLLDESFRDALSAIEQEGDLKRGRLYQHLRANILHYQRAIWQQEDPQQRSMRYRKSGRKVPLEWRFELESGATLTIDALDDRLAATTVDGQFVAYSRNGGGREADLDQLIDPVTGPIGYYANYAIYRMRPEFGSSDLFAMLHFFKSPYLSPNAETAVPPPELAELEGVTAAEAAERSQGAIEHPAEECLLIMEGGAGITTLTASIDGVPEATWAILLGGEGTGMPRLLAGRGAAAVLTNDAADEPVVLARAGGRRTRRLLAGAGAATVHEPVIPAGNNQWLRPSPITGQAASSLDHSLTG